MSTDKKEKKNYIHGVQSYGGSGTFLPMSRQDSLKYPYIASMGVYVFRRDILLKLLRYTRSSNSVGVSSMPDSFVFPLGVNIRNQMTSDQISSLLL